MNMTNIMNSLLLMGQGMAAIFVVMLVLYAAVMILLKVGSRK